MKKLLPIILLLMVIVMVVVLVKIVGQKKTSNSEDTNQNEPEITVNVPMEERPFVSLTPNSDGHELKLQIANLAGATKVKYQLGYTAGDLERGAIGEIILSGEKNVTRNLTLGSCSKNVCKYDENITGGTLELSISGNKNQKYTVPFVLRQGKQATDGLILEKTFIFTGSLTSAAYYVAMETIGLPGQMTQGSVVGNPVGIFSSGSVVSKGVVQFNDPGIVAGTKIYGFDAANKWKEYAKVVDASANQLSVETDRLTTFTLVNQ
jgi:hypothetical protein